MMELFPGMVCPMTHANILSQDGNMRLGYNATKGNRLVFLFLGAEPKDGSKPLSVDQFLINAGWTPPPVDEEHVG